MNPQEPSFIISLVSLVQPLIQKIIEISTKVDTSVKIDTIEKKIEEKDTTIGQKKETG